MDSAIRITSIDRLFATTARPELHRISAFALGALVMRHAQVTHVQTKVSPAASTHLFVGGAPS